MSSGDPVWLGFTRMGGRFEVEREDLGGGMAILGEGANQLAPLVGYACVEAGLKALVLDVDGRVSDRLSGYMRQFDASYFLYDSLSIEENPEVHAQLLAGAYSTALDLSFEQEASLNAIAQVIANERGVAGPAALADLIQSPDAAKGRAVDRLRARLENLRSLPLGGERDAVKTVIGESAVLNFRGAGSPESRETAVALSTAKVLALLDAGAPGPDVVVLVDANRLFKDRPVFRKSQRFLSALVSSPVAKVLASDEAYALDRDYLDTCSMRVLSSSAWNQSGRGGGLVLTPNMFMFQNPSYGASEVFVPREFEGKRGQATGGPPVEPRGDEEVARRILEEVGSYQDATRTSVMSFLATEFGQALLDKTFERLQGEGFIVVTRTERSGRTIHFVSLTDKGKRELGRRSA